MAEAVVDLVFEKLASILTEEVKLFRGAREEVRYIKEELDAMRWLLRNADTNMGTGEEDENFKAWLNQVREMAFCIEDIIDNWTFYMAHRRDHRGFLRKLCRLLKKLKERRHIAHEIREIKKKVVEAKDRYDRYNMSSRALPGTGEGASGSVTRDNSSNLYDPRMNSLFVAEADVVGIQGPKEDLISRLVDGDVVSKNKVISVVGIGGLGKTTLVKKVFDNPRVADYCDCHAWITVSQSFRKDEMLRDLIKQFRSTKKKDPAAALERMDTLGEISLISKLREYLSKKRYVVVFDDVWKTDFWDYIKLALPENEKGSRIIFTTRNKNAIPSSEESPFHHIYKPKRLCANKAFELFCKKAFHSNKECCPPNLMELSHAIVERCGGLPLAIVILGGLLATKRKDVSEWQKLNDGLHSMLASNQPLEDDLQLASIKRVLSFSYHDLPHHLKICFLYLGMFPENYVMNCNRIMKLWMGQGFIKRRKGLASVDVAQEYIIELLHRSLVQVERVSVDNRVKKCRIHDLLRETIILPRLEELGLQVLGVGDTNVSGRCRHLAIQDWKNDVVEHLNIPQSRSMILFGQGEQLEAFLSTFLEKSKLLRVLDLEKAPLEYIPEELGNLWHLTYLSLRDTYVKTLPNSIGKLCNLETLDLRDSLVYDLPVEINKLLKLQYLLAFSIDYESHRTRGAKIHNGIGCLEALQKLYQIEVDQGPQLIGELGRLTQLQKLGIGKLRATDGLTLCSILEKMTRLRSLYIHSANAEEPLKLESMIFPPPLLGTLSLCGPLGKLPHWIPKLKNLVKFGLISSKLEGHEDPLQVLQALPNLEELRVIQGYEGERLHFSKSCFRKMKVLHLLRLDRLKTLVIEKDALPFLRELYLGPFPQLERLPNFPFSGDLAIRDLIEHGRSHVLELVLDPTVSTKKVKKGKQLALERGHVDWNINHVLNIGVKFSGARDRSVRPKISRLLERFPRRA